MDKKTLLGFAIIGLILFGFSWYSSRQQKQFAREQAIADSIYRAQNPEPLAEQPLGEPMPEATSAQDGGAAADSMMAARLGNHLMEASRGDEQFYLLENERIKLFVSSLGGRVASVELKEYKAYGGAPLMLFDAESSQFDLRFFLQSAYGENQISTSAYHFRPIQSAPGSLTMRLEVGEGAYIDYLYTLSEDEYMVDFDIRFTGMERHFSHRSGMNIAWGSTGNRNEKGFDNENTYCDITYMVPGTRDDMERLGMSKGEQSESVDHRIHWIAFKQQFFSSILIAEPSFERADLHYSTYAAESGKIKEYDAAIDLDFAAQTTQGYDLRFYFGPNKYSVLRKYDLGIERLVPLGWGIFGWINRWIVIPVFDFLNKYIASFGLIILLLTLFVKLITMPLTYKSYLSSAKMRLLKPEMDELAAKYPEQKDMAKKQQATMELYRKAGVSPMGGCLPMLIQLPFLIAMFRFFPAAIELRQQSFLWADDLSSYDSILDLPFSIPFYGAHVSLFALLMVVAMYFSQRLSMAQQPQMSGQMAGMRFMSLYLMPIMMLLWFNNYSSALSYYYGLSSLITIVQTWGFRYAIDEQKLHAQMKANAKKPRKKSKWAERYEAMLKEQQRQQAQRRK